MSSRARAHSRKSHKAIRPHYHIVCESQVKNHNNMWDTNHCWYAQPVKFNSIQQRNPFRYECYLVQKKRWLHEVISICFSHLCKWPKPKENSQNQMANGWKLEIPSQQNSVNSSKMLHCLEWQTICKVLRSVSPISSREKR